VESRPIYKKIDKYEQAGDPKCLEPAWKEHWEELRVDIITALALALLFDALLEETTEVGGSTFGPIILEAFCLGCGLKTGLKAPAQSITHVRWMAISIIKQFLPKGVLRDLFQSKVVKANKPILQFFKFMDNRFFTAERSLTFQVDAQLAYEKRRWDTSSESSSTFFTDFMGLNDKFCEAQRARKSNKDFTCTTLDVWNRLHIAIEYSLSDNAVLDTTIENLVAAIHKNSDDIDQKMLDDFVEKIVLRGPRFRATGQLPALRVPQARHAHQGYSPAPTLQSSTPPIAHYGHQQSQRPGAAPVYMSRTLRKLRHKTAVKVLLMVQSLRNSTATTNDKPSMVPSSLSRKQMAKPGSSFLKKNMLSIGRRTNVTTSLNVADVIF
jgi:hypothetical protein